MQQYRFSLPLTITNINSLYKTISKLIAQTKLLELDLSSIANIDSAGIAFLLELKSTAKQHDCTLTFIKPPEIVEHFCQLYKVSL